MWCLCRFAMAVAGLVCLAMQPARAEPPAAFDHAGVGRRVLEKVVRPGYRQLAEAATGMLGVLERRCARRTSADLARIAAGFDGLIEAWGRVEFLAFGPITEANRAERLLFWPDRRGLGDRQVVQALAQRDASVLDARVLAGRSVALQGLGALDRVLFEEGAAADDDAARAHRCGFAVAITASLATTAREVVDAWEVPDGYARAWLEPGNANPAYASPLDRTVALAKVLDRGIERIRDERLGGPLGFNKQRRKVPAPLAHSGRGVRLAKANIAGLHSFYVAGGFEHAIAASGTATGGAIRARAQGVAKDLADARDRLAALDGDRHPFQNASRVALIAAAGFPLKSARREAAALMTLAAGVPAGFSVTDGD